jgi:hypothetical protein
MQVSGKSREIRNIMEAALLNELDKKNTKHLAENGVHACEARLQALRECLDVNGPAHEQLEEVRSCEDDLLTLRRQLDDAEINFLAARSEIARLRKMYISDSTNEVQPKKEQQV